MKKFAARNRFRLALLFTVIVTSLSLLITLGNNPDESPSNVSSHLVADDSNRESAQIQSGRRLGMLSRSHLNLKSSGYFRFGGSDQNGQALIDQSLESSFRAEIDEIVIEDDALSIKTYVVPSKMNLVLTLNGHEAKGLAQEIQGDLSSGFILLRDRDGQVLDVIMPRVSRDHASDFAYSLAKAMQATFPEGKLKREWSSFEEDSHGQYQARYGISRQDRDKVEVRKEKVLYSRLNARIEGNLGDNVLSSETGGHLDLVYDLKTQALQSVSGEEKLTLLDENQQRLGENNQILQWQLLEGRVLEQSRMADIREIIDANFRDNPSYRDLRAEASERQLRTMYENRLGQDNLETILADLKASAGESDEEVFLKRQTELFLKARALVYLHPEELPRIHDLLRSAEVDAPWFQTMTSALLNISSPEAQRVLAGLSLERRDEPKAMESLIPDLGFLQNPEPEVEEALRLLQQHEPTRNMADLAFATMGSQLAQATAPDARERLQRVVEDVHAGLQSQNSGELTHGLDMVGNLSSPESLPFLKDVLRHENPEVRAVAAFALRDIKSAEAEGLLKGVLSGEENAEVRLQAATALQNFKTSRELLDFVGVILLREGSERVRIQLLLAVAKARFVDPEGVRRVLVSRSQGDPHEQVRTYADILLTEFHALSGD